MLEYNSIKTFTALIAGIAAGAVASIVMLPVFGYERLGFSTTTDHYSYEEYHTHADFLLVINDTETDLSGDAYMSVAARVLHPEVHLHDNHDDVIHFHAPNISLVEFLASLGIAVTPECITLKNEIHCVDENTVLRLYVHTEDRTADLLTYVPLDEDRALLYLGTPNNPSLPSYLEAVTDEACIYSGTCPERGTAPPESCGLSCEL